VLLLTSTYISTTSTQTTTADTTSTDPDLHETEDEDHLHEEDEHLHEEDHLDEDHEEDHLDEKHDDHDEHDHDDVVVDDSSKIKYSWFWAITSGIGVGLLGFASAICIGPMFKSKDGKASKGMKTFLTVLIAFAAGSLVGDALIHLIPAAFGAEEAEDEHAHEEEEVPHEAHRFL